MPLILGAAVACVVLLADGFFPEPRLALDDLMLKLRGPRALHGSIAFVDFETWPHPRDRIARAIDLVKGAGARVIALDVLLENVSEPKADGALAEAIARSGCVVLPVDEEGGPGPGQPRPLLPEMERNAAATGLANFLLDRDGTVRQVRLRTPTRRAFSLAIHEAYRSREAHDAQASQVSLPGPLVIDWADISSKPGTQVAPFKALLDDDAYRKGLERFRFFQDRIVILGHLQASSAGDTFLTPLSRTAAHRVAGAVVHANVLSNLLEDRRLRHAGKLVGLGLLLAASISGALAARARTTVRSAVAVAVPGTLLLGGSYFSLTSARLIVSAVPPVAGCFLAYLVMQLLAARVVQRLPVVRRVMALLAVAPRSDTAILDIVSERRPSGIELTFLLREGSGPDARVVRTRSIALSDSLESLEARLDALLESADGSPPEEELFELGLDIPAELMSTELVAALTALKATHLHLELSAADLAVPWELARIGDRALAERFGVSRALIAEGHHNAPPPLPTRETHLRALLVANPLPLQRGFEPLPTAEREVLRLAADLRRLARTASVDLEVDILCGLDATLDAVLEELRSARVDLLHYSGHAVYRGRTSDQSGFLFHQGVLGPALIRDELGGTAAPAVVFANGCGTGRFGTGDQADKGPQASRVSLPAAFQDAGARLYGGTLWPIETVSASRFATTFYAALVGGRTAGEALQKARAATKGYWVTHAAYVMYGDPRLRVVGRDAAEAETSEVTK